MPKDFPKKVSNNLGYSYYLLILEIRTNIYWCAGTFARHLTAHSLNQASMVQQWLHIHGVGGAAYQHNLVYLFPQLRIFCLILFLNFCVLRGTVLCLGISPRRHFFPFKVASHSDPHPSSDSPRSLCTSGHQCSV